MTLRRIQLTVAVWLVLSLSLWATDSNPAVFVLGGIVAAIAAGVFIAFDLATASTRVQWPARHATGMSAHEGDPRATKLRRQAGAALWRDPTQTHSRLVALVDDRLLTHHHIDRTEAPAAAEVLLTPTLRRLVEGPRRSGNTLRELRGILSDIEEL